jgi:hypothetical protein
MGCNREEAKNEALAREWRKSRPAEEKESDRQLEAMERASGSAPSGTKAMWACGREGDVYELFFKVTASERLFLIRVIRRRLTAGSGKILEEARKMAV